MTCNICGIDQLRRIHQTIAAWNAKQSPKVITCHKKTQIIKKKPNGNKVNPPNKGSIFLEAHELRKPKNICNKVPNNLPGHTIFSQFNKQSTVEYPSKVFKQIISVFKLPTCQRKHFY